MSDNELGYLCMAKRRTIRDIIEAYKEVGGNYTQAGLYLGDIMENSEAMGATKDLFVWECYLQGN